MQTEKSLTIKNLVPGLTERGKIKIGEKGDWVKSRGGKDFQLPKKLDHFLITTMERDARTGNFLQDTELMENLAGDGPLTRIPIRLLYNDIELNFQTRYSCYSGTQLVCYGDGQDAYRLNKDQARDRVPCPCQAQDPKYNGQYKCKINGTLSCIIDSAEIVGGVWKFRTTSYNSVVGILSSLTLIRRISGGYLAGLPLDLTIAPKTVNNPIDGKAQTVWVVNIEFKGSVQALRDEGYRYALEDKKHDLRIADIEAEAKRLLSPDAAGFNEIAEDVKTEFYPQDEKGDRIGEPGTGAAPPMAQPAEDPGQGPDGAQDAGQPAQGPDKAQGGGKTQPAKKGKRGRPSKTKDADPAPPMAQPDAGGDPGPAQGAQDAGQPAQGPDITNKPAEAQDGAQDAPGGKQDTSGGQPAGGKLSLF